MTRILHVATRFRRGGAERNIAHVIEWERRAGFEVDLAVGARPDAALIPAELNLHVIEPLVRPIDPIRDARALLALRRLIRGGRYDIIHTHLSKAGIVGRLAARGLGPKIAHTVHMASFGQGYSVPASVVFRALERYAASCTSLYVYVGNELRERYIGERIGDASKSLVVRSHVNLDAFLNTRSWDANRRKAARRALGLPDGRRLLVSVGVLEPRKRHALLIRELGTAMQAQDLHLAIAGDGDVAELEALATRLNVRDHVSFLGHVDDVASLMAAANVSVHAAEVEGVPQAILQALAAGVPTVATDVIGLHEVPGANVRVVPFSGHGLGAAVVAQLEAHRDEVPASAFAEWTSSCVDAAIANFHARLAD